MSDHSRHPRHRVVIDLAGRLRLDEDSNIIVRPFGPGDRHLLLTGFAKLSPRSRYHRFLSPISRLSDSLLDLLMSVDGENHRAWVALTADGREAVGPAAFVRWARTDADPAVADVAVTVMDDYQGRGLGGRMLDLAVVDASAHGVDRFAGPVLASNTASHWMLVHRGATLRHDGSGVITYTLALRPRLERLRRIPPVDLVGHCSGPPFARLSPPNGTKPRRADDVTIAGGSA